MAPTTTPAATPFDLSDDDAYQTWRDWKLARHPKSLDELVVEVNDISAPSDAEFAAIRDLCDRANMAVYRCRTHCDDPHKVRERLRACAEQFGMRQIENHRSMAEDGLVALEVVREGRPSWFHPLHQQADQMAYRRLLQSARGADPGDALALRETRAIGWH